MPVTSAHTSHRRFVSSPGRPPASRSSIRSRRSPATTHGPPISAGSAARTDTTSSMHRALDTDAHEGSLADSCPPGRCCAGGFGALPGSEASLPSQPNGPTRGGSRRVGSTVHPGTMDDHELQGRSAHRASIDHAARAPLWASVRSVRRLSPAGRLTDETGQQLRLRMRLRHGRIQIDLAARHVTVDVGAVVRFVLTRVVPVPCWTLPFATASSGSVAPDPGSAFSACVHRPGRLCR